MDLQLNKQSLAVRKCVVDETAEYPIDISFTLPDYCPGIDRILKCEIKPTVISINSMSSSALSTIGKSSIKAKSKVLILLKMT